MPIAMSQEEVEEVEMQLHEQVEALAHQVKAISKPVAELQQLQRLAPAIYFLVVASVGFGSWMATLEWRLQSHSEKTREQAMVDLRHDATLEALQLWRERTSAQAVTAAEIATIVAAMKDSLATLDKRQQRTEDAIEGVSTQLDRIEGRLNGGQGR
jgi:chaperonin cofactor prefoldin